MKRAAGRQNGAEDEQKMTVFLSTSFALQEESGVNAQLTADCAFNYGECLKI